MLKLVIDTNVVISSLLKTGEQPRSHHVSCPPGGLHALCD